MRLVVPVVITPQLDQYRYSYKNVSVSFTFLFYVLVCPISQITSYDHSDTFCRSSQKTIQIHSAFRNVADFRYKWKYVLLTICIDDKERLLLFVYHRELGESLKLYRLICSRVGVRKGSANTKRRNLL